MGDDALVRGLLEEALNSGRSPEDVCAACPEHLEEVRGRWLRIRNLADDLERAFPSSGPPREWPGKSAGRSGGPQALPNIPGYEVEAVIGRGGMGVVYKARHLKLRRTVAVKMLIAGDHASSKELTGLLREAQALAGLGHPHIVEVFDAGELDGLPYFTMEFVEGGSLAEKLRGVPLPPSEAAALVESLAQAVQVAHDKGIVHRDLKPGNVLLESDGTPKISDFGLARRLDGNTHHTLGAARVGTPSYMGPEQALGTSGAFHPLVDVYSLGAILYETLAGRPPFRSDSPAETQRQVISEEPVPPSRINRKVPRDLETICLKCLQKSPSARYASADKLAQDLRRYLNGEPISARRTAAAVRAFKWTRRHPAMTTGFGFGLLVIVASVVGLAWYLAAASSSRRAIESDLDEVERAHRGSDWATAKSALDRASVHLGAGGPNDLRLRLDGAKRDADTVRRLESLRMARAFGSGTPQAYVQSDNDYAALYRDAGIGTDSDSPTEVVRSIRGSGISGALIAGMYDWMVCVRTLSRRDWVLATLLIADSDQGGWRDRSRDPALWKNPEEMKKLIAQARFQGESLEFSLWFAQLVKELGHDTVPLLRDIQVAHSNDFWANYVLADTLQHRGQYLEALRFIQAAVAVRPGAAVIHNDLGNCLGALNRADESIRELQEAVRLDPASPAYRANLALAYEAAGRYSEAAEHNELGVRQWPNDVLLRVNYGEVLAHLDRNNEALEQYTKAGVLNPRVGIVREAIMAGLIRLGKGSDAIGIFQSWIKSSGSTYWEWDGFAEVCACVEATDEYDGVRRSLLDKFGSDTDPLICEELGRACLLAPIPESQWEVANAVIDRILDRERLRPTWRGPYVKLSKALSEYRGGHPDAALGLIDPEISKVLQPMPQLVTALALSDLHRHSDALSALGRAAMMFDWRLSAATKRETWMCHVLRREAESKILSNVDTFTRDSYWPNTPDERLALVAMSEERGMHLATARLFAEVLASDPALARDSECQCRFRAACAAAMCGSGRSKDAHQLTPEEQAHWREQSLQWLRAELRHLRESGFNADSRKKIAKWRADPDLSGVRDPTILVNLSEDERRAFVAFWADVNGVLAATATN
jgi:serine/threonine-protein kinase